MKKRFYSSILERRPCRLGYYWDIVSLTVTLFDTAFKTATNPGRCGMRGKKNFRIYVVEGRGGLLNTHTHTSLPLSHTLSVTHMFPPLSHTHNSLSLHLVLAAAACPTTSSARRPPPRAPPLVHHPTHALGNSPPASSPLSTTGAAVFGAWTRPACLACASAAAARLATVCAFLAATHFGKHGLVHCA